MGLAALVGASGCGPSLGGSAEIPVSDRAPFTAVSMRAHPLTRLVRENGIPVRVEAHVEFFDRWGHTVKALGTLRFELSGASTGGGGTDPDRSSAEPVRWASIDLINPSASSRAFDPATGTYWVRLSLPPNVTLGGSPRLDVVFTGRQDRRLTSSIELE